jgi:hypothetical protein
MVWTAAPNASIRESPDTKAWKKLFEKSKPTIFGISVDIPIVVVELVVAIRRAIEGRAIEARSSHELAE